MNKEQLKAILKETFPEKRIVEKESMLAVVIHEDHLYRQTQDPEGRYLEKLAENFFRMYGQRPDVGIRCLYFGFQKEAEHPVQFSEDHKKELRDLFYSETWEKPYYLQIVGKSIGPDMQTVTQINPNYVEWLERNLLKMKEEQKILTDSLLTLSKNEDH